MAGAGVTRWRRRRSDRGPSGREPAAVVAKGITALTHRAPFPAREVAGKAWQRQRHRNKWPSLGTPRTLHKLRPDQKKKNPKQQTIRLTGGDQVPLGGFWGPVTPKANVFRFLPPSSAALLRGRAQRPLSSSKRCRGLAPASVLVSQDGEQQRLQGGIHCRREI